MHFVRLFLDTDNLRLAVTAADPIRDREPSQGRLACFPACSLLSLPTLCSWKTNRRAKSTSRWAPQLSSIVPRLRLFPLMTLFGWSFESLRMNHSLVFFYSDSEMRNVLGFTHAPMLVRAGVGPFHVATAAQNSCGPGDLFTFGLWTSLRRLGLGHQISQAGKWPSPIYAGQELHLPPKCASQISRPYRRP